MADIIKTGNSLLKHKIDTIISNALYENINGFHLESVDRYSSISGLGSGRQQYSELIITANY